MKNKKIGVWGYGIVGQSAVQFFNSLSSSVQVLEERDLLKKETDYLLKNKIPILKENIAVFFKRNDYILPSPGINTNPYAKQLKGKIICELDLFSQYFKSPTIAVTGSVGKTTIVHLLDQILKAYQLTILTGGNIGIPMLSLLRKKGDYGLLELSSFQLEHSKTFSPTLGVITNFSANHLDRHQTEKNYLNAKLNLFAHQTAKQSSLIPLELFEKIKCSTFFTSRVHLFTTQNLCKRTFINFPNELCIYFLEDNIIKKYQNRSLQSLININCLPDSTFIQNWLTISAVLDILNLDIQQLPVYAQSVQIPEHRMEKIATINQVTFYNDSKSTSPSATLAAIEKLKGKTIALFLGGLSKGINREPFIEQLKNKVNFIFSFGIEAEHLQKYASKYHIPSSFHHSLDEAFSASIKQIKQFDTILFSPAGSSFDLFENYEKRGNYFKQLVTTFEKSISK